METRANYVLIGAFTLIVSVLLLGFALWAAKYSSDRSWNEFDVVFREPVTGLSEGSSVQYNGIAVGTVDNLMLAPQDPRQVIARLRIQANAPVKTDTRARLSMTSLTGAPIIQLTGGSPDAPKLVPESSDRVPVIQTEASALQNIADTANRLVERLDQVLSEDNVARIAATLEHIEGMTGAVANQREDLGAMIVNARRASEQLEQTLTTTNRAMSNFDRELVQKLPGLVARLDSTLTRLDSAAGGADTILNENRAAISSFANDGLSQLGPTLGELRALVRDLRRISDRLDANPARYLLGRDAPKEFDPE
ncbi:MCE family protein [Luteimonas sp. BDR2-5]|uniref:MlaD family protein n=1 Tax=Proluteimonas luteida TaxID=2878685 RepID=UPI001E5DFCE3|nr:MlaD family protein [Luteimonas sp. BDR2-5]MCD9027322.1 MCE family protein [Luteimonas sp. BDR2-5]